MWTRCLRFHEAGKGGATLKKDGKKNVCQEGGAAMRCMTVLNYPDQCMGGRMGGSFRSTAGRGFTHTNVIRGTPIDIMGK